MTGCASEDAEVDELGEEEDSEPPELYFGDVSRAGRLRRTQSQGTSARGHTQSGPDLHILEKIPPGPAASLGSDPRARLWTDVNIITVSVIKVSVINISVINVSVINVSVINISVIISRIPPSKEV